MEKNIIIWRWANIHILTKCWIVRIIDEMLQEHAHYWYSNQLNSSSLSSWIVSHYMNVRKRRGRRNVLCCRADKACACDNVKMTCQIVIPSCLTCLNSCYSLTPSRSNDHWTRESECLSRVCSRPVSRRPKKIWLSRRFCRRLSRDHNDLLGVKVVII